MRRAAAIIAIYAIGILSWAAGASAACAVTDIEIKEWSWSREAGWFSLAAQLVNNCAEPAAPQIQVTFRDAAGQVVNIDESWPTGKNSIPPKGTYALKTSSRGYATAKNVSIRVINVRQ